MQRILALPTGPATLGALPLPNPAAMDLHTVRAWICAFADQTSEHVILLLDLNLTVLWANQTACKILGAEQATIVDGAVHRYFTEEDRELGIPEHEAAVAASMGDSEDDRWMLRADGSRFWATGRTVCLRDAQDSPVGMCKIFRDQTDYWMNISTLHNRIGALEADGQRYLSAIATAAHEIRDPLSVAGVYVHLIEQEVANPALQDRFRSMQASIDTIARLVSDLELASRTLTGKITLLIEPLLLHELIDEAIETTLDRAGRPSRTIETILPAGQPIELHGDRVRLQQVLGNLLGNALKFTHDGGHVWIRATTEADQVVIRMEDDGIGIPSDRLGFIFDMFTQVSTSARSTSGLGIGLALVKNIVELHGGSTQAISSGPGTGAVFIVRLPMMPLQQVES